MIQAQDAFSQKIYTAALLLADSAEYWANYNLGQALVRLGQQGEGKRYLAKAESLQAELKNIQDWENLVENNPDQLMLWVNYGESLRRAGRVDEAIEAFQVALSIEPRFVALRNNLAILYMMRGDTAAALYSYKAILELHPSLPDVWLNLGVFYAKCGKMEEARKAWENVLKYAPKDSTAKAYLAKLPGKS
ncbi:tetratricopeptide repeat protein [candidate division KSB1 bacterium]|nr:tetratricopeptide repeat protein [candidate division KSB1 bacterium]